ncbi:MAG: GGDEF domain-containing protein [Xanthomonadales bacterium]|nr:GGDEF domain-containing protein [Xanthomonadales bacterium]MBK7146642.1 GGDEF domain-containing protein [Xanthomonadales bacterium]
MTMLSWSAAVLAATALVLAIGFSRHRLLLFAIVLAATIAARGQGGDRALDSVLAFAPLLLLVAAVMPEARWRTKRNAGWLLLFAFALLMSLHAPAHVVAALDRFLIELWPGSHPGRGAMIVVLVAAMVCLGRWVLRGATAEWTACLALLAMAIAFAHWSDAERALLGLAAAGLLIVLGLLYGAYRMAFVDALSGLRNRRALDEALERLSGSYAIAMVDIDHFKSFNDSHGHAAGDIVLREVATRLRRHAGGASYRYGGEEFCIVFEDRTQERADDLLESVRAAIEARAFRIRPIGRDGKPGKPKDVKVTVSLGVADRSDKRRTPKEVITAADKALYRAKASGRNRVMRG